MASTYDVISTIASTSATAATVSSSPLIYHAALKVGKHGLKMMAVSGAASLVPPIITTIRGGGGGGGSTSKIQVKKQQKDTIQKKKTETSSSSFKFELTPKGKSVAWMALGMVNNNTSRQDSLIDID